MGGTEHRPLSTDHFCGRESPAFLLPRSFRKDRLRQNVRLLLPDGSIWEVSAVWVSEQVLYQQPKSNQWSGYTDLRPMDRVNRYFRDHTADDLNTRPVAGYIFDIIRWIEVAELAATERARAEEQRKSAALLDALRRVRADLLLPNRPPHWAVLAPGTVVAMTAALMAAGDPVPAAS